MTTFPLKMTRSQTTEKVAIVIVIILFVCLFIFSDSSIPSHPSRSEVDSPEFRVMMLALWLVLCDRTGEGSSEKNCCR